MEIEYENQEELTDLDQEEIARLIYVDEQAGVDIGRPPRGGVD